MHPNETEVLKQEVSEDNSVFEQTGDSPSHCLNEPSSLQFYSDDPNKENVFDFHLSDKSMEAFTNRDSILPDRIQITSENVHDDQHVSRICTVPARPCSKDDNMDYHDDVNEVNVLARCQFITASNEESWDVLTNSNSILPDRIDTSPRTMSGAISVQFKTEAAFLVTNSPSIMKEEDHYMSRYPSSYADSDTEPGDPLALCFQCENCSLPFPSLTLLNQHISGWPPGMPACSGSNVVGLHRSSGTREGRPGGEASASSLPRNSISAQKKERKIRGRESEKTCLCAFCGDAFEIRSRLRKHEAFAHVVGKCVHVCSCFVAFSSFISLSAHLSRVHSGECIHSCDECDATYNNATSLCWHQLHAHAVAGPDGSVPGEKCASTPERTDADMVFTCAICEAAFVNSISMRVHQLRVHQRVHGTGLPEHTQRTDPPVSHEAFRLKKEENLCLKCGKAFPLRTQLRRHLEKVHGDGRHQCTKCGEEFRVRDDLRQHQTEVHWRGKRHECDACGKVYQSKIKLDLHQQQGHCQQAPHAGLQMGLNRHRHQQQVRKQERPHRCTECGAAFRLKTELHQHQEQVHMPHLCAKCGAGFRLETELHQHQEQVHEQEKHHVCAKCGAAFRLKTELHQHQEQVHMPHLCSECGAAFRLETELHQHQEQVHMPHLCTECGAGFRLETELLQHQEQVHEQEKPHVCAKCGVAFRLKRELRQHERHCRLHVCAACGEAFWYKRQLDGHQHRAHGAGKSPLVYATCGETFQRKRELHLHKLLTHREHKPHAHTCVPCGEVFRNASALRRHERSKHLAADAVQPAVVAAKEKKDTAKEKKDTARRERTHACSKCEARYGSRAALEFHLKKKHSEEGIHACTECDKVFSRPGPLLEHARRAHGTLLPYVCDVCGSAFRYASKLHQHKKNKHRAWSHRYACKKGCGQVFHWPSMLRYHECRLDEAAHGEA